MTDTDDAQTATANRPLTLCEECEARGDHPTGGWDDHPKLHYGPRTMHHDCAPATVRRDVLGGGSAHSAATEVTRAIFAAADKGTRGHKLRAHITKLHADAAKAADAPTTESE